MYRPTKRYRCVKRRVVFAVGLGAPGARGCLLTQFRAPARRSRLHPGQTTRGRDTDRTAPGSPRLVTTIARHRIQKRKPFRFGRDFQNTVPAHCANTIAKYASLHVSDLSRRFIINFLTIRVTFAYKLVFGTQSLEPLLFKGLKWLKTLLVVRIVLEDLWTEIREGWAVSSRGLWRSCGKRRMD